MNTLPHFFMRPALLPMGTKASTDEGMEIIIASLEEKPDEPNALSWVGQGNLPFREPASWPVEI